MPEVPSWRNLKALENFLYFWVDRVTQQEIEDVGFGKGLAYKNELLLPNPAGTLKTYRPYVRPYLCFSLANIYWTFNVPGTVQNPGDKRWKRHGSCPLRSKGKGLLAKGGGLTGETEQEKRNCFAEVHYEVDLAVSVYFAKGKMSIFGWITRCCSFGTQSFLSAAVSVSLH